MNTYVTKAADVNREWLVIDAADQTLGRLATVIASLLRGKHKVNYATNMDMGDFVVVVNASKIVVTGNRLDDKMYRRHTGYPGGLVEIPLRTMLDKHPDRVISYAVKGMLPKTKLGSVMIKKLRVFAGPEHTHVTQEPKSLEI